MLQEEEKKALAPGGFKHGTSRLRDSHSNRFATNTGQNGIEKILTDQRQVTVPPFFAKKSFRHKEPIY